MPTYKDVFSRKNKPRTLDLYGKKVKVFEPIIVQMDDNPTHNDTIIGVRQGLNENINIGTFDEGLNVLSPGVQEPFNEKDYPEMRNNWNKLLELWGITPNSNRVKEEKNGDKLNYLNYVNL